MATPAQIAANTSNALHSTGPVTAAGKEAVRENALTHGLTSRRLIIPGEDPKDFENLCGTVAARYNPQTPEERRLAGCIAESEWRLARAWHAHDAYVESHTQCTDSELPPFDALSLMFGRPEDQRGLSLVMRYIRAIERARQSAIAALVTAQKQTAAGQEQSQHAVGGVLEEQTDAEPASNTPESQPATASAPVVAPLTRAERRALERAQRKAARREMALFRKTTAALAASNC